METYEMIKVLREQRGLSQEALAHLVGYSDRSSIAKVEAGKVDLSQSKIALFAKALSVTPGHLMGIQALPTLPAPNITDDFVTFPVIGQIAAGYDEIAVEDWNGDTVDIPLSYLKGRRKSEFFVLSVHGNSMYPMYLDGDKVLILKQTTLNNSGEVGAILYDDNTATLKRVEYVEGEDWMKLIPINPEYAPKTIEGADLESCRVIGIPRLLIREI